MRFFSDNAAPVCQPVLDAIMAANCVDAAYDGDVLSRSLDEAFSALFEASVAALWVSTGTAANALALAALCPPHGSVICHRDAHIQNDECGAPEFYTHGAKLLLADGEGAKLTPAAVTALLDTIRDDVHQAQPAALSITNASEYGRVYTPAEMGALGQLARERGLGLHVDGARFANAVAHLGCSPADLSWRAGVDILSFSSAPSWRRRRATASKEAGISCRRDATRRPSCWRCLPAISGWSMPVPPMPALPGLARRQARD
jgi:threonine aldolase